MAAGALLGGCSARQNAPASARVSMLTLPKVKVSEDRVIRTVVGLRPFRPPGFHVEKERHGLKTIVHNSNR